MLIFSILPVDPSLLARTLTSFIYIDTNRAPYEDQSLKMINDTFAADELSQLKIWSTEYNEERLPISEILIQIAYGCQTPEEPKPKL